MFEKRLPPRSTRWTESQEDRIRERATHWNASFSDVITILTTEGLNMLSRVDVRVAALQVQTRNTRRAKLARVIQPHGTSLQDPGTPTPFARSHAAAPSYTDLTRRPKQ